jgi:membrane protein YqaA with SNARE-associated domain
MLTLFEVILLFATSFVINIIPFFGLSNIFIAALAAVNIDITSFSSVLTIGVLVALGATIARIIHYKAIPLISSRFNEKKLTTLEANAAKINKHAFLWLCLTAATPLPEEPVIISLAAMKYNIIKFSTAFFLGKVVITTMSAFAGNNIGNIFTEWISNTFPAWLTPDILITIMSTLLAIIITVILLKVDLSKPAFPKRMYSAHRYIYKHICNNIAID